MVQAHRHCCKQYTQGCLCPCAWSYGADGQELGAALVCHWPPGEDDDFTLLSYLHVGPHCHLLVRLQVLMVAYLILAWPYYVWQLQWLEVLAHVLETGICICAVVLMNGHDRLAARWTMTGEIDCCCVLLLNSTLTHSYLPCRLALVHIPSDPSV